MATARVTLQIVGPVKRTTFQREGVDPGVENLTDVLHWLWSTRLQINRLRASLRDEFGAWGLRHRLRARRRFSATTYDEHLVMVAAAHLDRALRSVPRKWRRDVQLPMSSRRELSLLRDIYEHWDELRRQYRSGGPLRGAALKLKIHFPTAEPWSFTFDPKSGEIVLANVVAVDVLDRELRRLEAHVLRTERRPPNR